MKKTAQSPSNIAFIKYWGKTDSKTRVPTNNSVSMCLSNVYSTCTVEFDEKYQQDDVNFIDEAVVKEKELKRIYQVIERVRAKAGIITKAKVVTKNNFPKAAGIASSASGLSAVSMAAAGAAGLNLDKKELSKLSRLASGSACRSIPDGFVEWEAGNSPENSYAKTIFEPGWWKIADVIAVTDKKMKKISSTSGHKIADTSPFYKTRLAGIPDKIAKLKQAIKEKDFTAFGQILEQEALNMHAVCLTSTPAVIYWSGATMNIISTIVSAREENIVEAYFTIDAGSSVHVICQQQDAAKVTKLLQAVDGVTKIYSNQPGIGARFIENHLF